jgi:hypothetical protein
MTISVSFKRFDTRNENFNQFFSHSKFDVERSMPVRLEGSMFILSVFDLPALP